MLPLKLPYNILHFINILLSPNICTFWDTETFLHSHLIFSTLLNLTFLTWETQKLKFDKFLPCTLSPTQNEPKEPKRSQINPHLDYETAVHILLEDAACRCFDLAHTDLAHLSPNRTTHLKSPKKQHQVVSGAFCKATMLSMASWVHCYTFTKGLTAHHLQLCVSSTLISVNCRTPPTSQSWHFDDKTSLTKFQHAVLVKLRFHDRPEGWQTCSSKITPSSQVFLLVWQQEKVGSSWGPEWTHSDFCGLQTGKAPLSMFYSVVDHIVLWMVCCSWKFSCQLSSHFSSWQAKYIIQANLLFTLLKDFFSKEEDTVTNMHTCTRALFVHNGLAVPHVRIHMGCLR